MSPGQTPFVEEDSNYWKLQKRYQMDLVVNIFQGIAEIWVHGNISSL